MEQDTAAVAAARAASDATAKIVVVEGEPGPSTSQEEGAAAAAAAAEATVATEQSEEVNRKGVCVQGGAGGERSRAGHSGGPRRRPFCADRYPRARGDGGRRRRVGWGRRHSFWHSLPSPFPARRLEGGGGAGARAPRGVQGAVIPGLGGLQSPSVAPSPLRIPGTGVTRGVGDGAAQEPASASPSPFAPSPPLPVGLCLGNLGPSIPHSC